MKMWVWVRPRYIGGRVAPVMLCGVNMKDQQISNRLYYERYLLLRIPITTMKRPSQPSMQMHYYCQKLIEEDHDTGRS